MLIIFIFCVDVPPRQHFQNICKQEKTSLPWQPCYTNHCCFLNILTGKRKNKNKSTRLATRKNIQIV